MASYSIDVELYSSCFFFVFQRNDITNMVVMGITCYVEPASSGVYFCRLSFRDCFSFFSFLGVYFTIGSGSLSERPLANLFFTLMELHELRISIMNRKGDALTSFDFFFFFAFFLLAVNVMCWVREPARYRSVRDMC